MKGVSDGSLVKLIHTLIRHYLPEHIRNFVNLNVMDLNAARKKSNPNSLPSYFLDRPQHVVKKMYDRWQRAKASAIFPIVVGPGKFRIQSFQRQKRGAQVKFYDVDWNSPLGKSPCSCDDDFEFCKHVFRVAECTPHKLNTLPDHIFRNASNSSIMPSFFGADVSEPLSFQSPQVAQIKNHLPQPPVVSVTRAKQTSRWFRQMSEKISTLSHWISDDLKPEQVQELGLVAQDMHASVLRFQQVFGKDDSVPRPPRSLLHKPINSVSEVRKPRKRANPAKSLPVLNVGGRKKSGRTNLHTQGSGIFNRERSIRNFDLMSRPVSELSYKEQKVRQLKKIQQKVARALEKKDFGLARKQDLTENKRKKRKLNPPNE